MPHIGKKQFFETVLRWRYIRYKENHIKYMQLIQCDDKNIINVITKKIC